MSARNYFACLCLLIGLLSIGDARELRVEAAKKVVSLGEDTYVTCFLQSAVDISKAEVVQFYKRQVTVEASPEEPISTGIFVHNAYKDRFNVIVRPDSATPHTEYELRIAASTYEDSGEYGCAVPQGNEQASIVWAPLAVQRDVDEIRMTATDVNGTEFDLKDGDTYRFTQKQGYLIKCEASGAIPKPDMVFSLGDQDVTSQLFNRSDVPVKTHDNVGARDLIKYKSTIISKEQFIVNAPQTIACKASVGNMPGKTFTFQTEYPHPPQASCEKTIAAPLATNVKLVCKADAFPNITHSYWSVTIASGRTYNISSKAEGGGDLDHYKVEETYTESHSKLTTTLILPGPIRANHFAQTFKVVVMNEEGVQSAEAPFVKDPNAGESTSSASALMSSILLLCISQVLRLFFRS